LGRGLWKVVMSNKPNLFDLGQTSATPDAIAVMVKFGINPSTLISRHVTGDWGDIPAEDAAENQFSLGKDLRIMSAYGPDGDPSRLWVITEADCSRTTILTPEEY